MGVFLLSVEGEEDIPEHLRGRCHIMRKTS